MTLKAVQDMACGAAVALALAAIGCGSQALDHPDHQAPARSVPEVTRVQRLCQEDDPCWTWSKMGNRRRSVVDLATGERVVVGPCTFRHMWMNGNARLGAGDRMRGDWWAIHHGCDRGTLALHANGLPEGS